MKVKVKRVRGGSMGDQRNYGLVTGSIWNYEDKPTSNAVGDTIQKSPRDKANIEAERGETVVGDIDSDGMLEHLKIGGKRHHSGGTPLNVPDGSFVFSDTSALRIKNKDLLKNIFGMNSSKSGVTPAQVARRYQLNDYKELLNDPWADPFEKRTAQMMMDNNLKKLGQLALIQESMKGFPDGIPNIALPLFASDMGQQQMMRKGGLVKAQGGKNVKKSREQTILDYHPAANNPLNYDPDMIYERDPSYDFARGFFGVLRNPVSAGAYFMDPSARTQSWGSYVNNPPTMLDLPFNFTPFGSRLAAIGSIPYLAQYQKAGETKEDEEEKSFFDKYYGAIIGGLSGVGTAGLGYFGTKAIAKGLEALKNTPIWEKSIPAVTKVVPAINPRSGQPYQKRLLNPKTGLPYKIGPKKGRAIIEEVSPARRVGIKPTIQSIGSYVKNLPPKYRWIAAGILSSIAAGAVGGHYFQSKKEKEQANKIVDPNLDAAAAAGDSIPALNYSTSPDTTDYRSIIFTGNQGTATPTAPPAAAPTAIQRNIPSTSQPTTTQNNIFDAQKRVLDTAAFLRAAGIQVAPQQQKFGGNSLPRFQGTQQSQTGLYDIAVPGLISSAGSDIDFVYPPYYTGWSSIGPQLTGDYYQRGPSYEILPKIGLKNPKTGVSYSGLDDLINYADPYINFEDYDTETNDKAKGIAQWKKDASSKNDAVRKKANLWYIDRVNAYNKAIIGSNAPDTIRTDIPGYWELGSRNLQPQFAVRKAKVAAPQQQVAQPVAETKKPDDIQVKRQEYAPGLAMRPEIWNFDKVNMANAMLNRAMIERGADPTLYRYNPYLAEAVYMDPSYDIAAQQGALATATQALGATAPTQQARANILQAQAQTAEPIAQITSQTNKANIALANQMAQQQAQAYNQAQLQNIQFQKRWEDEKEVLRQQYQNALAEGNTELAKSIMQAMKNAATTAWVNATQDQYAVDPATGSVYFKGGKDPRLFGATESDYATMGAGIDAFASAAGISREKAAELYLKYIAGKGSSKKSKVNPLTGEEARYGGKYKFGGEVFNPIDDIWN